MNPDPSHDTIPPESRLLLFTAQTFMQKWMYDMPVAANMIFLTDMQMNDIQRLATLTDKNIKNGTRHSNKSNHYIHYCQLHQRIEVRTRYPDLFGLMNGITGQYKTGNISSNRNRTQSCVCPLPLLGKRNTHHGVHHIGKLGQITFQTYH